MSRYVALLHVESAVSGGVERWHEDLPGLVAGVDRVAVDAAGSSVCVWFDRPLASIAEIVRALESLGAVVRGVAQSREVSRVGGSARTAG